MRGEADVAVPGEAGMRVLELALLALESAETARTIDVEFAEAVA